jgi:hypothetical protein
MHDGLVAQALEIWAASKAASIMVGIFLVAAAVTVVAVIPAMVLRVRRRDPATEGDGPDEETTHDETIAF